MKQNKQPKHGYWRLFLVLAVCAAPVVMSYLTYYVIKPQSRTNYGALLDPRAYPMPALAMTTLDGQPASLNQYHGKWIMLHVDGADCPERCQKELFTMRQLRLTQGKEMDRIERVWLIADAHPLDTFIMRQYEGTHMLRANLALLEAWLPTEFGHLSDHIYLIDPLGNLMMRFPKNADPNKMKRDLTRLLKASHIG